MPVISVDVGADATQSPSKSSTYVDPARSDGSNNEPPIVYAVKPLVDMRVDAALSGRPEGAPPASSLRGGFRYLTVSNPGSVPLDLQGASVDITFSLQPYANYFYSDDALLNRVWYGGAYTIQTNIISGDQGRVWGPPSVGWRNDARVGELGSTVLVDGAKRDRTVWPGDLGISVPTDYASLGDMVTIRNSLQTLFNHQRADGALP